MGWTWLFAFYFLSWVNIHLLDGDALTVFSPLLSHTLQGKEVHLYSNNVIVTGREICLIGNMYMMWKGVEGGWFRVVENTNQAIMYIFSSPPSYLLWQIFVNIFDDLRIFVVIFPAPNQSYHSSSLCSDNSFCGRVSFNKWSRKITCHHHSKSRQLFLKVKVVHWSQ